MITDLNGFKEWISAGSINVAYFSTPQCNVCKVLRPKVESAVSEMRNVEFLYLDTTQFPEIAGQYTVFAVPTIILFADGREAKRFSRHFTVEELSESISRLHSLMF